MAYMQHRADLGEGGRRRSAVPAGAPVAEVIGRQVRTARKRLGMDQRELALVAAVSPRTVHAVEHGKATVRLDVLVRVLKGVGLDLMAVSRERSRTAGQP
jgi:HTH-type transcriptional regulator/antitoxin HipB